MNFLELTLRNIKRNFKLYTIYLLSMIIGVIINFTFSSLMYNDDIISALENKEAFKQGILIASFVIFLFIIFFILYANSFFMKQRKKELGMYLLFGMKESQITLMIFYETLVLAFLSLVIGIFTGGILSKFFGMILMNLMNYDNVIKLSFPINAILSTTILFLLLATIISIQTYISIKKLELIELFHAREKTDKPIKPIAWVAILSVVLMASAYFVISRGKDSNLWDNHSNFAMIISAIGIIGGTYLFFAQFSSWILNVITKRKRYHEGDTALWTSSLRFQIRGNSLNLTFISLFSAAIIMLVSFVYINYKVQFTAVELNVPNDIAFEETTKATDDKLNSIIENSLYKINDVNTIKTLEVTSISEKGIAFENPEYYYENLLLVSEEDYNKIVNLRDDKDKMVSLKDNETVSLAQGIDIPKMLPSVKFDVAIDDNTSESLSLIEQKDYALLGWGTSPTASMDKKSPVLVISNEKYNSLKDISKVKTFRLYDIENEKNAMDLSIKLSPIVSKEAVPYYSSFADVYSKQIESSSLLFFSASFLAIIALFALANILYFKQLKEATEEQHQYRILRKIGVDDKTLKKSINKQLLFVFFPPLVLGLCHSFIIIKYYVLDSVQSFPEAKYNLLYVELLYFILYFLIYTVSTKVYYNIANNKL